jgi:hypothetical protein
VSDQPLDLERDVNLTDQEDDEVQRSREAERILEDPMFREAFLALEERLVERWKTSKLQETALREETYRLFVALQEVRGYLTTLMETGKLAIVAALRRQSPKPGEGGSTTEPSG